MHFLTKKELWHEALERRALSRVVRGMLIESRVASQAMQARMGLLSTSLKTVAFYRHHSDGTETHDTSEETESRGSG